MASERSARPPSTLPGATDVLGVRLASGPALLLDGALGTELERRGAPCALPLWSTHALLARPALVEAIHREYVTAGAEVLTANTFRTQRRTLARAGLAGREAELSALAVALARRAANGSLEGRRVWVAGSVAPLEDCYEPGRVPDDATLAREHAAHARTLVRAGVDLLLIETMNTCREAEAALRAARAEGAPAWVSFVCGPAARLLSGESLADAVAAVRPLSPGAVLVNCLPPRDVPACLAVLAESGLPFGVYANLGAPDVGGGFRSSDDCGPEGYAGHAAAWTRAGARIVGGCCGTTPAHLRAVARGIGR